VVLFLEREREVSGVDQVEIRSIRVCAMVKLKVSVMYRQ
jgi:hypothetical protein